MSKSKTSDKHSGINSRDIDILNKIKSRFEKQLEKEEINVKVGEILKIIELQNRLSSDDEAKKEFWKIIEAVRRKGLKNE